jgi:hypothetical protein
MESPDTAALSAWLTDQLGVTRPDLLRLFRTFNAAAPAFEAASRAAEEPTP